MDDLKKIYNLLYNKYNSQGWWPLTRNGKVIHDPKFTVANLAEKEQLEIAIGAILTQNTNWSNVEKAILQLHKEKILDIKKLKDIKHERLAQLIRSSGYFNQKAKKIKNFINFLFKKYNGKLNKLFSLDIDKLRAELLSINGIGKETADSIILYSAKKPIFVIDAYTKRIINRFGFKEENYDDLQDLFMKNLDNNVKLFNEYHALLVKHGKDVCKKIPLCDKCVLNSECKKLF